MTDPTPDETPTGRTAEPEARERALNRARLLVKRGEVHDLYPHVMYKTDEVSAIAWLLEQYDALEAQVAACRNGSDWAMAEQFESDLKRMTQERDQARAQMEQFVQAVVDTAAERDNAREASRLWEALHKERHQERDALNTELTQALARATTAEANATAWEQHAHEVEASKEEWRKETVALRARAQEAQATASIAIEALRGLFETFHGFGMDGKFGWSAVVMIPEERAIIDKASQVLSDLPAAVRSHIDRTARLDAFVAAYDAVTKLEGETDKWAGRGTEWLEERRRLVRELAAYRAAVGSEGGTE